MRRKDAQTVTQLLGKRKGDQAKNSKAILDRTFHLEPLVFQSKSICFLVKFLLALKRLLTLNKAFHLEPLVCSQTLY